MVEKKTLTIAVLCVIIVLFFGSLASSGKEIRTLEGELEALGERYDELYSTIEAGKAIAESAEWISDDERLKVTSELIVSEHMLLGLQYTIRVNVTNIGSEPIDKVVIFVFPYRDGKFGQRSLSKAYQSHTAENLYIGETHSHDFTSLVDIGPDMTSYKVLAIAG